MKKMIAIMVILLSPFAQSATDISFSAGDVRCSQKQADPYFWELSIEPETRRNPYGVKEGYDGVQGKFTIGGKFGAEDSQIDCARLFNRVMEIKDAEYQRIKTDSEFTSVLSRYQDVDFDNAVDVNK